MRIIVAVLMVLALAGAARAADDRWLAEMGRFYLACVDAALARDVARDAAEAYCGCATKALDDRIGEAEEAQAIAGTAAELDAFVQERFDRYTPAIIEECVQE